MAARNMRNRFRFRPLVNRLEDRTVPATHTWTGAAGDGLWSTAGNWDNNTAPTAQEGIDAADDVKLIFPAVANRATTQDISDLIVDRIELQADNYTIQVNQEFTFRRGHDHENPLSSQILCSAGTTDTISGGTIRPGADGAEITVDTGAALTISAVLGVDDSANDTGSFSKSGLGKLTLSGDNTFDKNFEVSAGTVVAKSANAVGIGGVDLDDGATLDVQADLAAIVKINPASEPPSRGHFLITSAGTGTINGNVGLNLNAPDTLTIGGNGNQNISGIHDGDAGLTKIGTGTTTISGEATTFTGLTTLTAGTLVENGLIGGAVAVTAGKLGGNGAIGALTTTGGIVAPGLESAPATLLTGNASLAGSIFAPVISGTNGDELVVSGSVNLTGATLNVRHTGAATPVGTKLLVIANDGTDKVTGTFANTPEGSVVADNTGTFYKVSYKGGTGNDVTLTAVAAPKITIANIKVAEGDTGTTSAAFTVKLSAPLTKDLTITFKTQAGTATAGKDYVAITSQTVTIPAGATSCPINVKVIGDKLDEANETFKVAISKIAGVHGIGGAGTSATATIVDNDPTPKPTPKLSISDVKKKEGNSGTTAFVFTVKLSAASGQTVTVNFATANGTAKAGIDYSAVKGKLTFKPGQKSKTITVKVKGGTAKEANEKFTVKLSKPLHATLKKGVGTGTIINDD